jgi:dCTP diphosphatase
MNDQETTVAQLKALLARFVAEREWEPYHTPKNLAMSLAIEAAELMEHFQWIDIKNSCEVIREPARREAIADEMADCLSYILALANAADIDLAAALQAKMKKNEQKYPVDLVRGRYERPPRDA